jgi:hypothetical protein
MDDVVIKVRGRGEIISPIDLERYTIVPSLATKEVVISDEFILAEAGLLALGAK